MRMRHEDKVDGRKIMRPDAGMAQTLHRAVPECPVGVDGDVDSAHLAKKASMPEPRYRDLAGFCDWQKAEALAWPTGRKQGGNEHLIEELDVSLAPPFGR